MELNNTYASQDFTPNELFQATEEAKKKIDPLENIFIPTWDNRPPEYPPVLSLNGVGILTYQNLTALIAAQGMGKSSNCEAILSSFLNPECDALGYEVDQSITGIIYIDFERTNTDVWNSFYRMARRAKIPYGTDLTKVILVGMRSIPRLEQRKLAIEKLLVDNPLCKLLVMDGAADLVTDSNDLPEAIECRIWIREITVKYELSIFTTLHPNPNSLKPRGHIGSEIMREAEAVMAIQEQDDLKIIYSKFEHGKNRNGAPIWGAYEWDDDEKMMCQREVPDSLLGSSNKGNRKVQLKPAEFDHDFHVEVLHKVFSDEPLLNAEAFYKKMEKVWDAESNDNMLKSRAKLFRTYYINNDFIVIKKGDQNNEKLSELAEKYLYGKGLVNDF